MRYSILTPHQKKNDKTTRTSSILSNPKTMSNFHNYLLSTAAAQKQKLARTTVLASHLFCKEVKAAILLRHFSTSHFVPQELNICRFTLCDCGLVLQALEARFCFVFMLTKLIILKVFLLGLVFADIWTAY